MDALPDPFVENRLLAELEPGESASVSHTVSQRDIDLFAIATGDVNPAHVDPAYAETDMFHGIVMHGMWGAGLISSVLGTRLPGPGTIYLAQDLQFRHPVSIGDTITARVTVTAKDMQNDHVMLDCVCTNQHGDAVITGTAAVRAPTMKVRRKRIVLPDVRIGRHDKMHALVARASDGKPISTAIIHPIDAASLRAALAGADAGLIAPILIGPILELHAAAKQIGRDISAYRLVDTSDAEASAAQGVSLARAGECAMLMKGDLHTDELMHAVCASQTGLRTCKRISHVFLMDVPDYPRLLLLTDAAVNIAPTLEEKAAIIQNAIDLALIIGIEKPRVAILAAAEMVNPHMPSTLDAAILCKMADRGQITGGLLDGPLGFDNAISESAAVEKGIVSQVAGRADILVVPDLEAGNMLVKQLTFLSGAEAAGLVLGAGVPIILTSRADSAATRLASCALGVLAARSSQVGSV